MKRLGGRLALGVALGAALGCQAQPSPTSEPSALPAVSAPPSASQAPPPPSPAGALEGKWRGGASTKAHAFTYGGEPGASLGWKKDDGKLGVGPVELSLEVAPSGAVTGRATGALGALQARGQAEEEVLIVTLSPEADEPTAFSGTLTLRREGEQLKGTLQASTGDSLKARSAELTLARE